MAQPTLIKPIPDQIVNEGASFGPFNLNEYIQSTDLSGGSLRFTGELKTGASLPTGLICTESGLVSGIPGANTQGNYEIVIKAEDDTGLPLTVEFRLTIKERIKIETTETAEFYANLKSRVWEALGKDLPIPEIGEFLNRPITALEIYYLLQRYATLTIWDVYNLDAPGEKQLLKLEGMNEHYNIYDRGSCIVGTPKDLYSHKRNLEDALQTARVMAREVYKRGWVIEFAGFDKMVRGAWVELQVLGDKFNKPLEILHYTPSETDLRIYTTKGGAPGLKFDQ